MPRAEEMLRGTSRTDSISTLWSSADVPFCLDPRMARPGQPSDHLMGSGGMASQVSESSRLFAGPTSSQPCSIDLERPSLSLAEDRYYDDSFEVPSAVSSSRRFDGPSHVGASFCGDLPDRIIRGPGYANSPPKIASASSQASSLDRSLDSKQGDRLRPTEDLRNVSIPSMPASVSAGSGLTGERTSSASRSPTERQHAAQYVMGVHKSKKSPSREQGASKAAAATSLPGSGSTSGHSSSKNCVGQTANSTGSLKLRNKGRKSPDLYAHARQFFEPDYSMDSDLSGSQRPISPVMVGPNEQVEPVMSSAFSDMSHDDSMLSCAASQRSERLSSGDSFVLPEPSELQQSDYFIGLPPTKGGFVAIADQQRFFAGEHTPTREYAPVSGDMTEHSKDLPTLPSLPSFSPNGSPSLSGPNSPRGFASRHASRPRTADTSGDGSRCSLSPRRAVKGPPTPLKISRPMTSQAALMQATGPASSGSKTLANGSPPATHGLDPIGIGRPSTTGSKFRSRALSTSKLRPQSPWKLFGGDMPALPTLPGALLSRPSTAQVLSQGAQPKGRFRSRTLGESDRAVSLQPAPKPAKGLENEAAPPTRARRLSKSDALASPANESAKSIVLASNSSTSPSMPSTPKSPGRSRQKSSAGGWASYLTSGLTLHIEQEGRGSTQVNMSYLSYDPFGSPEALVGSGQDGKQGTSKRPKSRQDRDGEASQVGTLEFGQGDEMHQHLWPITSSTQRSAPILKHLTIGDDDVKADLLTRQAALMVKANGTHEVGGYELKGQLAWKFVYRVEDSAHATGDKLLVPVCFSCSATLLDPARARKSRILTSLRKQVVPNLVSKSVSASPASSKQDLPSVVGYAPSPPSSYRSQSSLRHEYLSHEKGSASAMLPAGLAGRPSYGETVASPSSMRQRFDSPYLTAHSAFLGTPATTKAPLSANSIASTDSSVLSSSQPITPLSSRGLGDSFHDRIRTQGSPVSPRFGRAPTSGEETNGTARRNLSAAEASRYDAMPNQLGLDGATLRIRQSSLALQEKASFGSDISTRSIQATGPPRMIGGKKLIPISLPPELQKRSRIDPAQLAASTTAARTPSASSTSTVPRQQPASPGPARVDAQGAGTAAHGAVALPQDSNRTAEAQRRIPSDRSRSQAGKSSSRPPTASEAVKLEYLARQNGRFAPLSTTTPGDSAQDRPLRAQRSHGTFILTPNATAGQEAQSTRRRSRTSEGAALTDPERPFTADAWGAAQYPPVAAARDALSPPDRDRNRSTLLQPQQQQQIPPRSSSHFDHNLAQLQQQQRRLHQLELQQESSVFLSHAGSAAQRARGSGFVRPRTAQNLMPDHSVRMPAAALVDISPHRS